MRFFVKLLSIVIFGLGLTSFSQENPWGLINDEALKAEVFTSFFKTKASLYRDLKNKYPNKISKLMQEELDEFYEDYKQEFEDQQFIFDRRFYDFVEEVFQNIKNKNPQVSNVKGLLISRETTLNAYSLPNDFIVVHVGLFYWLKNQDQMAAIIAHELGHSHLKHSLNHRAEMLMDENSKESKKNLRKIKKSRKGKSIKARAAFETSLYATSKHKREKEFEADSIGYHFLQNTDYDTNQIIASMELSSRYDSLQPVGLDAQVYKEYFDIKSQSFKEEWLKIEDLSNYNYDLLQSRFNKDSIATHPDMEFRIEKMIRQFPELKKNTNLAASPKFIELKKLAKLHRVVSLYEEELYANSLYECLYSIQNDEEVAYYSYWLGLNLQQLYASRKAYTFNKHVKRVNPKNQSESYMQFLSFLWNLSTSELETMANHYTVKSK